MGAAIDGKARAKQTTAANLIIDEEVIVDFVMLSVVVVIVIGFADAMGCFDDGASQEISRDFIEEIQSRIREIRVK